MGEPTLEKLEQAFYDMLAALETRPDKILILGGWLVSHVYPRFLWRLPRLDAQVTTTDLDIGVLESGPRAYDPQVIALLSKNPMFTVDRVTGKTGKCDDEFARVHWKDGKLVVPMDFITSFYVSDDTWNRFLGKGLSLSRLDGLEILLDNTIPVDVKSGARKFRISVPDPAAFVFHKCAVSMTQRGEDNPKKFKDLFVAWWVLFHAPDRDEILNRMKQFKEIDYMTLMRENLLKFVGAPNKLGYAKLRPFLTDQWDAATIDRNLRSVFDDLMKALEIHAGGR